MTDVRHRVALPGGELAIWQPSDAAELPDDRGGEWAPLVPYWAVLWRSGVALARELADAQLRRRRVVELGCGLGLPSLVAARAGADVLATDEDPEALELLERNARENGVTVTTARADWRDPGDLIARGPFDVALAADVLYEREAGAALVALLPRLAGEVWLADPGRDAAREPLDAVRHDWAVATTVTDGVEIHRLTLRE